MTKKRHQEPRFRHLENHRIELTTKEVEVRMILIEECTSSAGRRGRLSQKAEAVYLEEEFNSWIIPQGILWGAVGCRGSLKGERESKCLELFLLLKPGEEERRKKGNEVG